MSITEKVKMYKKDILLYLLSFLLPFFTLFLIFLINGFVAGNNILMRSDYLSGYIPILKETARNLINGNNIFFSFTSCLGLNNIFYLANIVFSPFNILFVLLYSLDENIITLIVVLLKIGCIGVSFRFFSIKFFKNNNFTSVIISSCYSLCAYALAYGTIVIMWLDAMMILPLLCVFIERCIKEHKKAGLIILYSYLFISNFYIAYMVGIFTFFFVIMYIFVLNKDRGDKNDKIFISISFVEWFISVIIAVLISAVIWVPTLFFIIANRSSDSTSIIDISATLIQIINSFYWGMGYAINGTYGYLYCGILSILCLIPFFLSKKIHKSEKIFWGGLLLIILLSMIVTPLNNIWHVFDQPDSFWYRYSFIASFIVCSIAMRYLSSIDSLEKKNVFISFATLVIIYSIVQLFSNVSGTDDTLYPYINDNLGLFINVIFLILWVLFIYLFFSCKNRKGLVSLLSIFILGFEIISGSNRLMTPTQNKDEYKLWHSFMDDTNNEIKSKDDGLFRVICTNNLIMADNSDAWIGYNGINDFGDQEKMNVRHFLSDIGFATSPRYIDDTGYTPVSEMLLGIKYNIVRPYDGIDLGVNEEEVDEGYFIKNDYALSIGYMVEDKVLRNEGFGRDVFYNSNTILKEMTGLNDECFVKTSDEKISLESKGIEVYPELNLMVRNAETGLLYIVVDESEYEDAYMQVELKDSSFVIEDYYVVGARNPGTLKYVPTSLSNANKMAHGSDGGYKIALYSANTSPQVLEYDSINVYYFDNKVFEEYFEALSQEQLNVSEWGNGYIKGNVIVNDNKRLLFTSIPYDAGWKAKVNGKEVEVTPLYDNTFIGIILPSSGKYEIELKYEVPGLKMGAITSLLGCIILIYFILKDKKVIKSNIV